MLGLLKPLLKPTFGFCLKTKHRNYVRTISTTYISNYIHRTDDLSWKMCFSAFLLGKFFVLMRFIKSGVKISPDSKYPIERHSFNSCARDNEV